MQRTKITATRVPGSNSFAVRPGSSRPVSTDVAGNNTRGRLKRKWLPHHISSSGNHASYRTDCRCCWWIASHDLDRTIHQRGRIMKLQTQWWQSQSRMPLPQRSLVELESAQRLTMRPITRESRQTPQKAICKTPVSVYSASNRPVIVLTSDFTCSTLVWKSLCSCASNSSSIMRSTPPAPRTTGTPT